MRFWDSSAIVPLICRERATAAMLRVYARDTDMLVWAFTRTEVLSALCKHARDGSLSQAGLDRARAKLERFEGDWIENIDYEGVRERAERLLGIHALSAADALQLAAALVALEERTRGFSFVTLDDRLAEAAAKEGFSVIGALK
jgi:predicted nucleic acid-binding protein